MPKYNPRPQNQFRRDLKMCVKRGYDMSLLKTRWLRRDKHGDFYSALACAEINKFRIALRLNKHGGFAAINTVRIKEFLEAPLTFTKPP